MGITTTESLLLEEIRPFPKKAKPRKPRKRAILTDTPVKAALEEKANSARTRKATEACRKLISNKEPVTTVSSKVESAKKAEERKEYKRKNLTKTRSLRYA